MYAKWPFFYTHVLCNAETCLEDAVAATQKVLRAFIQLQDLHGPSCDDVINF